jgi:hypothetical protein
MVNISLLLRKTNCTTRKPSTDITQEIHGALVIRAAVDSPGHDLKGQHAQAEDIDLGRDVPVHRILWRHVAAAEDVI